MDKIENLLGQLGAAGGRIFATETATEAAAVADEVRDLGAACDHATSRIYREAGRDAGRAALARWKEPVAITAQMARARLDALRDPAGFDRRTTARNLELARAQLADPDAAVREGAREALRFWRAEAAAGR